MVAVGDDFEDAVASEIGELDRDDATRRREPLVIRPFGLERLPDDAVEPDFLAVGHDEPRHLVFGRDRHVHRDHREREPTDLLERDRVLAARVAARLQLTAEQPREQRARLRLQELPIAARREPLARRRHAHGGRHERRGGDDGRRVRQREESRLDVRLALDHLEVQRQELLGLEAARALGQPLALEELLGLDALLRRPHADLITHRDLDATAAAEPLHDFRHRRLDNGVAHADDERDDRHALLAGGDAGDVARHDVRSRRDAADGVGLGDLLDAHAPERLLGLAEQLAGLGMAQLATLTKQ